MCSEELACSVCSEELVCSVCREELVQRVHCTCAAKSLYCVHCAHRVGQNHMYIRCIYGIFGREIIKYTAIYGVYRNVSYGLLGCSIQ